ncbi:MAG: DNA polymerase IV [Pseudomonadota bacterium]
MDPKSRSSWPAVIAHADLDAFYASAEQLDNPDLVGKPVLVGAENRRGVVLTASYEARPFGVGSAMPMMEALRRCPAAVVCTPRFERYTELSAAVMGVFRDFSPSVEPISLDEAFLDMSGTEHLFGTPGEMAEQLRAAVREATGGLTISVGVSSTKYVAKVASGYRKPNGVTIVPPDHAIDWLAPQPVSRLWGAGPKTQARMQAAGWHTVGDVAAASESALVAAFGSQGLRFKSLAQGIDPREVERSRRARSLSSERTLSEDLVDHRDIGAHLTQSAERLARRLRNKGWLAGGVRLKLKDTDFKLLSRQTAVAPTNTAAELAHVARELLKQVMHPGPFRLIGLGAYDLQPETSASQLDLFGSNDAAGQAQADGSRRAAKPVRAAESGPHGARQGAALERIIDALDERFGDGTVRRARDLSADTVLRVSPNLDRLTDLDDDVDG